MISSFSGSVYMQPLHLNIMWHQHQPYYRDGLSKRLVMPWARLHGTKDYYDMTAVLENYPNVHQTINLVPSLLEQIEGYVKHGFVDKYQELTQKPVDELDEDDRRFIIQHFFEAPAEMTDPFPRYGELRRLRGSGPVDDEMLRMFTPADLLDLQVLFNLVWIDPMWREAPGDVTAALEQQGRGYTEEQKHVLLQKQMDILSKIIPLHKDYQDQGRIEVTTTPYFHPILPLLIDSASALEAMPKNPMPHPPFRYPQDAEKQVQMAVEAYQNWFGREPRGMWPSEGSVSADLVPILARAGIKWIATDEEILARSTGIHLSRDAGGVLEQPDLLYRPYSLPCRDGSVAAIFRDHSLSDRIGFHYRRMEAKYAADDFMGRLHRIHQRTANMDGKFLVSVILDGENCWEYYPRDGHDFLEELYGRLNECEWLKCTTVSDFLEQSPPEDDIPRLFAGSWIDSNFYIWIGHQDDLAGWELLVEARNSLEMATAEGRVDAEVLEQAWRELYAAEGSDWFWWYGDDHSSDLDAQFDELFRNHLQTIYSLLDIEAPFSVFQPIGIKEQAPLGTPPRRLITPVLDGKNSSFFEWQGAGFYDVRAHGGAMHLASEVLESIHYGSDLEHFHLRLDTARPPRDCATLGFVFELQVLQPQQRTITLQCTDGVPLYQVIDPQAEDNGVLYSGESVAVDKIVEWSIPWEPLGIAEGEMFMWRLRLLEDNSEIGVYPSQRLLETSRPSQDYKRVHWIV
jgi:alpha-amylase/alpha-mannosidase (GH57 family)